MKWNEHLLLATIAGIIIGVSVFLVILWSFPSITSLVLTSFEIQINLVIPSILIILLVAIIIVYFLYQKAYYG
ncbi:MAG: hypothetical protein ACP6IP_06340 [Candidatus Njordarchaeia archaeon]